MNLRALLHRLPGRPLLALPLAAVLLLLLAPSHGYSEAADDSWVINDFAAQFAIRQDSSMAVTERIAVDFRSTPKHGIFRDIPVTYVYNDTHNRVYNLSVQSVKDERGSDYQYSVTHSDAYVRIKMGDPDRTITGKHTYVIAYTVKGSLNAFEDHDELYWNVSGDQWAVPMEHGSADLTIPGGALQQVACYQGANRSTEQCVGQMAGAQAHFEPTRVLPPGQQFTLIAAFPKGVVTEPKPILQRKDRELWEFFEVNPLTIAAAGLFGIAAVGGLGWAWWLFGRDKQYTSAYYLTQNEEEQTRPVFAHEPPTLEFTPPDKLKPAEIGVLLDERADTLDATATIVDLAVRGYLRIEEVHKSGILGLGGSTDWRFVSTDKTDGMAPYEQQLYNGLFHSGGSVLLSELKTRFHSYLKLAQDDLYAEAQQKGWFSVRPDTVRNYWRGLAIALMVLGGALVFIAGSQLGAGLVFIPLAVAGLVLLLLAGNMPRRTARGSEALRRILGFREYLVTAETHRQQFNEQQNIFATYLPYAMVFGCVDKWANALSVLGIDPGQATSGWYYGNNMNTMSFMAFSSSMNHFAGEISNVIVSTPSTSGGSGFSSGGGFSGGGGGGGGGGSW